MSQDYKFQNLDEDDENKSWLKFKEESDDVKKTFEGHEGREGKVGGSLPRDEGGETKPFSNEPLNTDKKKFVDKYKDNPEKVKQALKELNEFKGTFKVGLAKKPPEEILGIYHTKINSKFKSQKPIKEIANIVGKSDDTLRSHILGEIDEVKKESNIEEEIKKEAVDDLVSFVSKNLFKKAFESISKEKSELIKDKFIKGLIAKQGYKELTNMVMEVGGEEITKGEAERIVRTEMHAIKTASREFTYRQSDPEGKRLYVWRSVPDSRRSDICLNISNRSGGGVPLDELKKIVNEEAKKANPKWDTRDWQPHINCRSVVLRKV